MLLHLQQTNNASILENCFKNNYTCNYFRNILFVEMVYVDIFHTIKYTYIQYSFDSGDEDDMGDNGEEERVRFNGSME